MYIILAKVPVVKYFYLSYYEDQKLTGVHNIMVNPLFRQPVSQMAPLVTALRQLLADVTSEVVY